MIKTPQELRDRIESCSARLADKFEGKSGKRAIVLCGGTGCLSSNSKEIREKFEKIIAERGLGDKVTVNQVGCFGFCSQGPFVKIFPEDTLYRMVSLDDVDEIIETDIIGGGIVERLLYVDPVTKEKVAKQDDINFYKKQHRIALHGCGVIDPENIDEALGWGAYAGLAKALTMDRQEVINTILESGLRGRGGGGFPTGRKWQFAYNQDNDTKYVVCNGDEGDPGAFMDRSILEGNPLAVIEGMVIAGYAIGAQNGYFYVRAEYPIAVNRLRLAIAQAKQEGLLGENILGSGFSFDVHIRLGAGAFVCGEETALLNSIEGQRGMPRPRPPFPAVKGLWQKPTIVNNVETLACVPFILRNGVEAFATIRHRKVQGHQGLRSRRQDKQHRACRGADGHDTARAHLRYRRRHPRRKEVQGYPDRRTLGRLSSPRNISMSLSTFDNLVAKGSMMGSGGAIVMDEDNCMVDVAKFYMEFICDESCGKCTPCRIGTKRMLEILTKITKGQGTMEDLDELDELSKAVKTNSLCALGQTSANPIVSTLTHFRDEYEAHIKDKKCPAKVCKKLMQYKIMPDKCKGCSLCSRQCPVNAITGVIRSPFEIDQSKCIKCGMCISSCKFNAIVKE